ncbi:hypothetical protein BO226_19335 [Rhodococcus sp. 2G]|uniref:hypothetical protein n=1 Tax=Rhodococcus sp. 2G TaxID=1570939 RepID=UPI0009030B60|nr:hypothetical protein [Rhodococcus sp. 2G]APE11030.1 hypothetical protein BO226_19005 [Rhodococcus sp. 2G]APE11086.1 hypothetical protein BO226_19335 [Rhodococcus sp. 2G]
MTPPRDLADAQTRIDQLEQQLSEIRVYAERIRTDDINAVELPGDPDRMIVIVAILAAMTGVGDRILTILDGKADR